MNVLRRLFRIGHRVRTTRPYLGSRGRGVAWFCCCDAAGPAHARGWAATREHALRASREHVTEAL